MLHKLTSAQSLLDVYQLHLLFTRIQKLPKTQDTSESNVTVSQLNVLPNVSCVQELLNVCQCQL